MFGRNKIRRFHLSLVETAERGEVLEVGGLHESEIVRIHAIDVVHQYPFGHAETVLIEFDESRIGLADLLRYYFMVIDPVSVNRQGHDIGIQYLYLLVRVFE